MKKLLILTAVLSCTILAGCGGQSDVSERLDSIEQRLTALENGENVSSGQPADESSSDTQYSVPEEVKDATYTLSAGEYEVPGDIKEGKYDVVCVSGDGIFEVDTGDVLSDINEAMNIPGAEGNNYPNGIPKRSNTKLSAGDVVTIKEDLTVALIEKQ